MKTRAVVNLARSGRAGFEASIGEQGRRQTKQETTVGESNDYRFRQAAEAAANNADSEGADASNGCPRRQLLDGKGRFVEREQEEQMTQITGSNLSPGAPAPAAGGFPKSDADDLPVPGGRKFGEVPTAELMRVLIAAGVPVSTDMGRHEVAAAYSRHLETIGKGGWEAAVNAWLQGVPA